MADSQIALLQALADGTEYHSRKVGGRYLVSTDASELFLLGDRQGESVTIPLVGTPPHVLIIEFEGTVYWPFDANTKVQRLDKYRRFNVVPLPSAGVDAMLDRLDGINATIGQATGAGRTEEVHVMATDALLEAGQSATYVCPVAQPSAVYILVGTDAPYSLRATRIGYDGADYGPDGYVYPHCEEYVSPGPSSPVSPDIWLFMGTGNIGGLPMWDSHEEALRMQRAPLTDPNGTPCAVRIVNDPGVSDMIYSLSFYVIRGAIN